VAILMALLSSAVWGTSDFIGGLLSRRLPVFVVVATSQGAGLTAVTVVALATGGFTDGRGWVAPAIAGGLSLAVGLVMFYRALATGTMGIVSPLAALGVLVPVAVGLLRGDSPSVVTSIGVVVALAGAVAASGPELRGRTGARPIGLAAVSAVCFGITMVMLAQGAKASPVMSLWGMRCTSVSALTLVILVLARPGPGFAMRGADVPLIVLAGLGDAGANLLFSWASLRGYLSVVSVLASLYPAMTVLLARFVLHQRLLPVQLAGIVAALGGVVLVSLG
jgi:drug/metabolite transporter (DMT)-like permease